VRETTILETPGITLAAQFGVRRLFWPNASRAMTRRLQFMRGDANDFKISTIVRNSYGRHLVLLGCRSTTIGEFQRDAELGMDISELNFISTIGTGGFGRVWRVTVKEKFCGLARYRGFKEFAVKETADTDLARSEVKIGRILSGHPNIVRTISWGTGNGNIYFGMERLCGPSLMDYLLGQRRTVSEQSSLDLMSDVCSAVRHMHRMGIAHLDIKPNNVVLSGSRSTNRGASGAVLLDFGLSRICPRGTPFSSRWLTQRLGTPGFMSFQQSLDVPYDPGKADIFSVGVTWYMLLIGIGFFPFGRDFGPLDVYDEQVSEVRSTLLSARVSSETTDLLLRCLDLLPQRRPTAEELVILINDLRPADQVPGG